MGLFGALFDCILLSTAVAAGRRMTGVSVADMLVPRIKNDALRRGVNLYFNVGEITINKALALLKDTSPRETRDHDSIERGNKRD